VIPTAGLLDKLRN